ncbi:MAG: hypothetical protein LBB98_02645 [Treponema sp.]|jgi:hypothetical protein|nr:hypothetical protein [Treponema sp.]
MNQRTDRLPTTREGIPAMAANWITVCFARKTGWGIPQPALDIAKTRPPAPQQPR